MIAGAQRMACGNCGHGLFRMYCIQPHDSLDGYLQLAAECEKCSSASILRPMPTVLTVDWAQGAEGRLSRMEPSTGK